MPGTTDNTPDLVSMAQQFTGLPMGALIAGPLMAAADANHQMALTQVDFLMSTCFNKSQKTKDDPLVYTPVMIQMQLKRSVITPSAQPSTPSTPPTPPTPPTITSITSTIELPLLTILPLNSLAVDSATVSFLMEVTSSYSEDHNTTESSDTNANLSFDAKLGGSWWSVSLKGGVSYDKKSSETNDSHYKKSNNATYNVSVHAGQLPLPPGVGVIIQAFSSNISPITLPAPTPTPN